METKPQPWAKCINCNAFYSDAMINKQCPKCGGMVKSELRDNTWFECQNCQGTGGKDGKVCGICRGTGWKFQEPGANTF